MFGIEDAQSLKFNVYESNIYDNFGPANRTIIDSTNLSVVEDK